MVESCTSIMSFPRALLWPLLQSSSLCPSDWTKIGGMFHVWHCWELSSGGTIWNVKSMPLHCFHYSLRWSALTNAMQAGTGSSQGRCIADQTTDAGGYCGTLGSSCSWVCCTSSFQMRWIHLNAMLSLIIREDDWFETLSNRCPVHSSL